MNTKERLLSQSKSLFSTFPYFPSARSLIQILARECSPFERQSTEFSRLYERLEKSVSLTQTVRKPKISMKRTRLVVLPIQNHAGGFGLTHCDTTPFAYTERCVVSDPDQLDRIVQVEFDNNLSPIRCEDFEKVDAYLVLSGRVIGI